MLAAMAARFTLIAHVPHVHQHNILWISNRGPYYMLWLTPLTTESEFHLYYDI